jgi:hypothetical protein
MRTARAFAVPLVILALITFLPIPRSKVSASNRRPNKRMAIDNKFAGHWTSQIKFSNGDVFNDGVLDISEGTEPSENEVNVSHSQRGNSPGHIMSFPDRIEIQFPLSDGRTAHYNGILVRNNRIEGRFFITGRSQGHHARGVRFLFAEGGDWTAQAGST